MCTFVYCSLRQPLLQSIKTTHRRTHAHNLECIRLFKFRFDSPQLCYYGLKLPASLFILDQVELVNNEVTYVKVQLLLDKFVYQTIRFLNRANSQVCVRSPRLVRLSMHLDYL